MQKLKRSAVGNMRCGEIGSALAGILPLVIVMAIMCLGFLHVAVNTASSELGQRKESESFWAAETGLMLGAEWLYVLPCRLDAMTLWPGGIIEDVVPGYTENGFAVRIDIIRTRTRLRIRSTAYAQSGLAFHKVITQEADPRQLPPFDTSAFSYGILCGGTFDFAGCGSISSLDGSAVSLHANDSLHVTGNAGTALDISSTTGISVEKRSIDGSLTAPWMDIHRLAVITGETTVKDVAPVDIPKINLEPWYDVAELNGEVHYELYLDKSYMPAGGVLWVNGDATLKGGPGSTFDGMLIATGSISVEGQISVNAPHNGFALASRDGSIDVSTSGTIRGLIYVKSGHYTQTANGIHEGQLMVGGNITKGGNSDALTYRTCIPVTPGIGGSYGKLLVDGTWKETNVAVAGGEY